MFNNQNNQQIVHQGYPDPVKHVKPEYGMGNNMSHEYTENNLAQGQQSPQPEMTMKIRNSYTPSIIRVSYCPTCKKDTTNDIIKKVGRVGCAWITCLLFTTGILCWIPCHQEGCWCKDIHVICLKCSTLKYVIPAQCCPPE